MKITFEKAEHQHKDMLFEWLEKPHVKEFWDNSQEHRNDIVVFMNGRKEKSNYFNDIFSYWIGSADEVPYAFLLTSEVTNTQLDLPPLWRQHLSKTGKTYTIDFCIGNENYLGKGLAALTLEAFIQFFRTSIDQQADTFFIDPDENNPRAKRVYKKTGFKPVGDFIMEKGFFEGQTTILMIKNI